MSDFFRDLTEQVPDYIPGSLSRAIGEYVRSEAQERTKVERKPMRREVVQALVAARLARKAAK